MVTIEQLQAEIAELREQLTELQETTAPGRYKQPNSYYVGVARKRRDWEIALGRELRVRSTPLSE